MKVVLEFGVRGGTHTDNLVIPSQKLAAQIATGLVRAFTNEEVCTTEFLLGRRATRTSWTSSEHFVSVTKLEGSDRGPASSKLWSKRGTSQRRMSCAHCKAQWWWTPGSVIDPNDHMTPDGKKCLGQRAADM